MLTTTADPDEPHRMIEPWSRLRVLVSPLESTPSDRHPGSLATKSVITHRQSEVSIALCQISPALFAPSPDCNRDSSSSTTSSFATATAAALRYSRHTTRLRETPTEAPDTADLPTQALAGTKRTREPSPVAHSPSSGQHLSAMSSSKRGRKRNDNLPPNRARDVQRAFRARRAAHLQVGFLVSSEQSRRWLTISLSFRHSKLVLTSWKTRTIVSVFLLSAWTSSGLIVHFRVTCYA
jgi:hypothetical protein